MIQELQLLLCHALDLGHQHSYMVTMLMINFIFLRRIQSVLTCIRTSILILIEILGFLFRIIGHLVFVSPNGTLPRSTDRLLTRSTGTISVRPVLSKHLNGLNFDRMPLRRFRHVNIPTYIPSNSIYVPCV